MSTKLQNPGRYQAAVQRAEFGSASTGTPYLYLDLLTQSDEQIGAYLYLSERALESTVRTLREAFAFDGNFERIDQIVGKECSIVVEIESDEKGDRIRVRWINPLRKSAPISDHAEFLRGLTQKAARIAPRAPVAAAPTRAVAPRPPAAAPAPAAQPVATATDSDNVPF